MSWVPSGRKTIGVSYVPTHKVGPPEILSPPVGELSVEKMGKRIQQLVKDWCRFIGFIWRGTFVVL